MPEPLRRMSIWLVAPAILLGAFIILIMGMGRGVGQTTEGADTDSDGLPDAWELANFGDLSSAPNDDPDKDSLVNSFELEIGTNPQLADSDKDGQGDWIGIPGFLLQEKWPQKDGWPLGACDRRHEFNRPGAAQFYSSGAKAGGLGGTFSLERLRGRIIAPATGEYEFWITGGNWCELWLGVDESRFSARRQVGLSGSGTPPGPDDWEKFPSQKSKKVSLVAGKEYYVEIIHRGFRQPDEFALAWKIPGGVREAIPSKALRSYVPDPEDTDDDGMRDKWEASHGLVVGKQDAMEDPDGDGMVNVLEHDSDSDPQVAGSVAKLLSWSRWFPLENPEVEKNPKRADSVRVPDCKDAAPGFTFPSGAVASSFERLYGTVTAPADGLYSFWLRGKPSAELSLSTDSHGINKRLIAQSSTLRSGPGGAAQSGGRYMVRSVPIWLKKGEPHYIDATLAKNVSWARPTPQTWKETSLGGGPSGSWVDSKETTTATVRGAASFGGAAGDGMCFRYASVDAISEAICRVDANSLADGSGAGLMFRGSTDPFASFAALTFDSRRKIVFHSRGKDGDVEKAVESGISLAGTLRTQDAVWLRLRSDGKNCSAFWSIDGVKWYAIPRIELKFGKKLIGGPVAWGGNAKAATEVIFSNLVLGSLFPTGTIPARYLATPSADPEDVDGDSLPDAWERQNGLNSGSALGANGPFGDPDGDELTNAEEYKLGSDPRKVGGVPGYLSQERWEGIPGTQVSDLLESRAFKGPANVQRLTSKPDLEGGGTSDFRYGERLRGTLVAPASGTYRFWIAGDNGCSLALSDSADRSGRRVIASVDGADNGSTNLHQWDKAPTQASKEIKLVGGSEYFIEILHKEGRGPDHVSVAWSYLTSEGKSQEREILPSRVLKSYVPDPRDLDEDDLPDEWESRMGLNPKDNGFLDPQREGALGDYDGDRLTNLEEYRLGSNPCVADTDGDGVDDRDEIELYHSDPLRKDASPPVVIAKIPTRAFLPGGPRWFTSSVDGTIRSLDRRGESVWVFQVEKAGIYQVALTGWAESPKLPTPGVPVSLGVDGVEIGRGVLAAGPKLTRLAPVTRWLAPGRHKFSVFNHNVRSGVSMVVASMDILAMTGDDKDGDGFPDWLEASYQKLDHALPPSGGFTTSPACLEGMSRFFEDLEIETSKGEKVQANLGLSGRWYTDIPLDPGGEARTLNLAFEGGTITETLDVAWSETNLLGEDKEYQVRLGDAMRLTAYDPQGAAKGTEFSISANGNTLHRGAASSPFVFKFDKEGPLQISVESVSANGAKLVRTVAFVVSKADLGGEFGIPSDRSRTWVPPSLSAAAQIENDENLTLIETTGASGTPRSFEASFGVKVGTSGRVIARVPEGPILSSATIQGFYLAPATVTGDHQYIDTLPDGTRVILVGYVLDGKIPADLSIWIQLYVPDAVFANGDTWLHLTASDFDKNGRTQFKVYKAPGKGIPYVCHWIRPYGEGPPGRDPKAAPSTAPADSTIQQSE